MQRRKKNPQACSGAALLRRLGEAARAEVRVPRGLPLRGRLSVPHARAVRDEAGRSGAARRP